MDIKVVSSLIGFALVTTAGGIAQAATETSETTTTIERSTVDAPKPAPRVKEETTTTTKKGMFGRSKSETTTTRVERDPADSVTSSEVKSRTTTTERKY